ncbi:MAG TPA: hypothetical protein VGM27_16680 [Acidobacteriaceae bacterium]
MRTTVIFCIALLLTSFSDASASSNIGYVYGCITPAANGRSYWCATG